VWQIVGFNLVSPIRLEIVTERESAVVSLNGMERSAAESRLYSRETK
jgi:hypothetical protein